MNIYTMIAELSNTMSGEQFMNIFLKEEGDSLQLNINDKLKTECPETLSKASCSKNCFSCWKDALKDYGYEFEEDIAANILEEIENEEPEIIDMSKEYDFNEMLKEIQNDNTLSFLYRNKLYFIKDGKFKESLYQESIMTPLAEDCYIDKELLEATFYKTNVYNSSFLSAVSFKEAKEYLFEGYDVMFNIGEHMWHFFFQNNIVFISYEGNEGIDENNFTKIFMQDYLVSLYEEGEWLVVIEEGE